MRRCINLDDFKRLMELIEIFKCIDLMPGVSFVVLWEKKPKLTLNKLGNFEFENPQEVYGATLNFIGEDGGCIGSRRFILMERFEDDY